MVVSIVIYCVVMNDIGKIVFHCPSYRVVYIHVEWKVNLFCYSIITKLLELGKRQEVQFLLVS